MPAGGPEWAKRRDREANGIPLPDGLRAELEEVAPEPGDDAAGLAAHPMTEGIQITPTRAEALVLFEVLSRYAERGEDYEIKLLDPAEKHAFDALQCHFEKLLVEPLSPSYAECLASAKACLLKRHGVS